MVSVSFCFFLNPSRLHVSIDTELIKHEFLQGKNKIIKTIQFFLDSECSSIFFQIRVIFRFRRSRPKKNRNKNDPRSPVIRNFVPPQVLLAVSVVAAHLAFVSSDAEPGWTKTLVKKRVDNGQGRTRHLPDWENG